MNGSRLGRGRGGRLAIYGGCGVVILLLVLLYRAATSEMARLRELHVQCAHQQEALAAQLQVIFEYKARLEKSLAEEKSSIIAVKQELQLRASREKSLRDKDSVEAMQRFNSLQQTYKLLQTEHRDLQEEYKKREKQALEETNRLESTLQDLRGRLREVEKEKERSLEHLKSKYIELETERNRLDDKYNQLIRNGGDTDSIVQQLKEEISRLKSDLENAKNIYMRSTSGPSLASPVAAISQSALHKEDLHPIPSPARQQQQDMMYISPSSRKTDKAQNASTSANNANLISPALEKVASARMLSRLKVPAGVLPIPDLGEHVDNEEDIRYREKNRKLDDAAHNLQSRFVSGNAGSNKEKEVVEGGNLDPSIVGNPVRHVGEQILDRKANDVVFKADEQQVDEESNQLGRAPGLNDGRANDGDDQYDVGDYDKEPQQKNDIHLIEGEDEGEDEGDMIEYPHHLNQGKRE